LRALEKVGSVSVIASDSKTLIKGRRFVGKRYGVWRTVDTGIVSDEVFVGVDVATDADFAVERLAQRASADSLRSSVERSFAAAVVEVGAAILSRAEEERTGVVGVKRRCVLVPTNRTELAAFDI